MVSFFRWVYIDVWMNAIEVRSFLCKNLSQLKKYPPGYFRELKN